MKYWLIVMLSEALIRSYTLLTDSPFGRADRRGRARSGGAVQRGDAVVDDRNGGGARATHLGASHRPRPHRKRFKFKTFFASKF